MAVAVLHPEMLALSGNCRDHGNVVVAVLDQGRFCWWLFIVGMFDSKRRRTHGTRARDSSYDAFIFLAAVYISSGRKPYNVFGFIRREKTLSNLLSNAR